VVITPAAAMMSGDTGVSEAADRKSFLIGLCLALSSCVFIGISFIIKKIGLIRLSNRGLRAASGGFGYLKDWVWWTGLLFSQYSHAICRTY
jgi:hypothetical protein